MLTSQIPETVELVVGHRTVDSKIEYLVQWASDKEKTWEASNHLIECDEALTAYWRSFIEKNPHHSYIVPSPSEQPQPQTQEAKAQGKSAQKSREPGIKRQKKSVSRPVSEDKIAVAKRVQMNKMLAGSRSRGIRIAAAASSSSSMASVAEGRTAVKPPPAFAKRSSSDIAMENMASESPQSPRSPQIPQSAPSSDVPSSPPKPAAQRARKSTGRRLPGFSPAELPGADATMS
ncbi:hypothetical protein J3B02_002577 [Coemansia erecta]|uniref:Chromo domain-containing protein n=1 Tax=Coemansia asiatica TaxID=1052880 RepID=A0A9W7XMU8_9FUNG|nr:hypothetical protein LPJ64_002048 [Coemansia asiatica]KAJ2854634.1 hypothetical protein J3B02_002577 [Coemansia erecta]KAJ2888067.1 hypothetical protein FB639_000892 [Coemansia asiatica]